MVMFSLSLSLHLVQDAPAILQPSKAPSLAQFCEAGMLLGVKYVSHLESFWMHASLQNPDPIAKHLHIEQRVAKARGAKERSLGIDH